MFGKPGVIIRTSKKFVEIVAVTESYLVISVVQNKESNKQQSLTYLSIKLSDGSAYL